MPDRRAVNALTFRWHSQRETLGALLRKNGYDPKTLEVLPDPGECDCELATAIRQWHDVNRELDAAQAATSGWRY